MVQRKARRERPPLTPNTLAELALAYAGRFATTRGKLKSYLARKVRERGWDGAAAPDLEALADRFAAQGYVDDAAFALSKAQSLAARGYGKRRLLERLREAGVAEEDSAAAREHCDGEAVETALRFAERRRIGPFARTPADRGTREKALAAMVRAGHPFPLARAIAAMEPGATVNRDELADLAATLI